MVGVVAPHAVVKHFIYVRCIEIYGPAWNLNVLFEYAMLIDSYCNTEKAW